MIFSFASCGKKEEGGGSAQNDPQQPSQSRPEYYWDTHESTEMPYKGSTRYMIYSSYASVQQKSFIIASDETGASIAYIASLFTDTYGEMKDVYNDSEYVTWFVESKADMGSDPRGQKLSIRCTFYDYDKATVEMRLSAFLEDLDEDLDGKIIEGTFFTTALRSAGDSGYTAKYVRAQYEKETPLPDGTTVRQYCQCYKAYMPFEAPSGKTVYVEVEISEVRNDPADLSDKTILNFVFDRVHIGKSPQN